LKKTLWYRKIQNACHLVLL